MSTRPTGYGGYEAWGFISIINLVSVQIVRIVENDCIGFFVTNRGADTLIVEKRSQEICCISVWCRKFGGY